ncbi:hypothetical protein [Chitinophaga sp. MM2321]|uniref:hypothetical protein n=1 Tax=Chitinophaga sp. MM2321 TaxID=3137178 RepID=UPI0032D58303
MKKKIYSLLPLLYTVVAGYAQDSAYIQNQSTVAQPASGWISGKLASSYLQTTTGTSATGSRHHDFFAGTNTPAGANLRWSFGLQTLETGSNLGSDFKLWSYKDDGTYLATPLTILRSTGIVSIQVGIGTPWLNTNNSTGVLSIHGGANAANSYRGAEIDLRAGGHSITPGEMTFHTGIGGGGTAQPERMRINVAGLVTIGYGLSLTNPTSNLVNFNSVGISAPTINTRSIGTKLVLYSAVSATTSDYATGIESSHIWFSVPSNGNLQGFKFYGGTSQIGRIDGLGNSQWEGQGRFKGWLTGTAATGAAAEIGATASGASLIGFNRTTGVYIPLSLSGGTTATNQTIVTINNIGVGIGTPTPQSELSVKGTITAQRVKVTQTGWADYVFHKDYLLPSLQEVEAYINTHQHLDGIPSAVDVDKDGIDVGEMNKKLLAKVEELTLYLIEQNKKITALEEWKEKQEKERN